MAGAAGGIKSKTCGRWWQRRIMEARVWWGGGEDVRLLIRLVFTHELLASCEANRFCGRGHWHASARVEILRVEGLGCGVGTLTAFREQFEDHAVHGQLQNFQIAQRIMQCRGEICQLCASGDVVRVVRADSCGCRPSVNFSRPRSCNAELDV